ncbi:MAG: iron ABC transporter substrate-binding protein [Desulfobacterium sp.]|nr:iron ABC transporter substrate-binding protein [Desulfobacterium sp.]
MKISNCWNDHFWHGIMISIIVFSISLASLSRVFAVETGNIVVDSLGRHVIIPDTVERIGCMYAFTGHVVAMLGQADKIVAVSNGLKRDVLLADMFPAIQRAVVPKFQGAVNIEELTGAKPDIVFIQAETGQDSAMADKMNACGLTWITVDFHNMAQQLEVIEMIGKVIGATEKADEYNRYYIRCIEQVQNRIETEIPARSRLRVYHSTVEPNRTSLKNSLSSDWINASGLINVTSQESDGLFNGNDQAGMEQILLWNPDIILANEPGVADVIRKNPQWSPVTAVKNDRVYQLPIGISRWGHPGSLETPLAIFWTAKTVYPEKFRHIDMQEEVRNFYKLFFNYELSDNMIAQILSGKGMRLKKSGEKKKNKKGQEDGRSDMY